MGDDASDERQLFGERRPESVGFVAGDLGVVRFELAADRVGTFGMVERRTASSIAAGAERVAVGTSDDVLVASLDGDEFRQTGFGPAKAVSVDGDSLFAVGSDGQVGQLRGEGTGDGWRTVGEVDEPRRFDGPFLATGSGLVRVDGDLEPLGLDSVHDVARHDDGSGEVFAATADGLYRRGSDWEQILDESVVRVATADGSLAVLTEAGELLTGDGETWEQATLPSGQVPQDIAAGEGVYAVTEQGELFVSVDPATTSDGHRGWRSHVLGVRGVAALAVSYGLP